MGETISKENSVASHERVIETVVAKQNSNEPLANQDSAKPARDSRYTKGGYCEESPHHALAELLSYTTQKHGSS